MRNFFTVYVCMSKGKIEKFEIQRYLNQLFACKFKSRIKINWINEKNGFCLNLFKCIFIIKKGGERITSKSNTFFSTKKAFLCKCVKYVFLNMNYGLIESVLNFGDQFIFFLLVLQLWSLLSNVCCI